MGLDAEKFKEKSPFSIYDFFGYLFPGFFLVISVWVLCVVEGFKDRNSLSGPMRTLFVQTAEIASGGVLSKVFLACIAIVAVYALGHATATISHILLDRFFMQRVLGYPAYSFLGLHQRSEYQTSGYVIAFSFGLLGLTGSMLQSFGWPIGAWLRWGGAIGVLSAFVGVILVVLIKLRFVGKVAASLRNPTRRIDGAALSRLWKLQKIPKFWRRIYKHSFGILVTVLGSLLSLNKPLAPQIREGILRQLMDDFGIRRSSGPSDIFWISYYRITQLSPLVDSQIQNWMNMYSYSRNFAVAALPVPVILFIRQFLTGYKPAELEGWMNLLFLSLFVVFVLRYVLLYSSYYTKNTLRAYYVLTRKSEEVELVSV